MSFVYTCMYFIDKVMCSETDSSEHESKVHNFLQSIKFLDNQNESWFLITSLLYGVNRKTC